MPIVLIDERPFRIVHLWEMYAHLPPHGQAHLFAEPQHATPAWAKEREHGSTDDD